MTSPGRRRVWTSSWAIVLIVIGASLGSAAGISAILSYSYWGYVLSPPGVDSRVLGARKLVAAGSMMFVTPLSPADAPRMLVDTGQEVDVVSSLSGARAGDDALRLVPPRVDAAAWERDWRARNVVEEDTARISDERRAGLASLIEGTAGLVEGEYGNGFRTTRTVIMACELVGPEGEPLLLVAVATGEISNDHLAYYELLYDDGVAPPRLSDRRHWRFDVAGMEGIEFPVITAGLSFLFLGGSLPVTFVLLLVLRWSRWSRVRRGRCPMCWYDLVGRFENGCPECGWGMGSEGAAQRDLRRYGLFARPVDWLTRSPRWLTICALMVAAVRLWLHASMPGGAWSAAWWGRLFLLLGGGLAVAKLVGFWVRPEWLPRHPSRVRVVVAGLLVAGLLALAIFPTGTDLPLRWRFALSRASMERAAMEAGRDGFPKRAPVGMEQRAGLYVIGGIAPTTDGAGGCIVWWVVLVAGR